MIPAGPIKLTIEQVKAIATITWKAGHYESCTILVPGIRKCTCNRRVDPAR